MNQKQFKDVMRQLKLEALKTVKNSAPVRTGNLQDSVKVRDLVGGGFEIYIDTVQADYAKYTTEPWEKGLNPNQYWDKEASALFVKRAAFRLNGRTTHKRSDD